MYHCILSAIFLILAQNSFAQSATIAGTTTVCQNATNPLITFTGSGGTAPYTFTYKINGVTQPTIVTTSGNSVTVSAPTGTAGPFTYSLVSVSDSVPPNNSVSITGSVIVTVSTPPIVDYTFTNDNTCSGTNIQFTSSVSGTGPYTYSWNFGDSSALSSQQNPTHSFVSFGCGNAPFTVTLTVTSAGCTVTKTKTVTVKQKPDISFNDPNNLFSEPFNNCLGTSSYDMFSITVGNSSNSNCISSFSVNWGDGNTQSNITFPISHTYTSVGVYSMSITANGNNGCVNSKTYLVKNISNPLGGLNSPGSTQNLCAPTANLQFSISNWGSNSLDTTYSVDYGDGTLLMVTQNQLISSSYYNATTPANSANYPIPHIYTTSSCPATSFEVSLDVTNACGTTPFTLGNISILTKPVANFTAPAIGCVNSSILFTNTTASGYGQNCTQNSIFTWNFGDGTPIITTPLSTPQNINHTFTIPGIYTVTLTAQNFCGLTTKTQQICIEPPLIPLFTLNTTTGCIPLPITATNTSNLTNQCGAPTYLWAVTYAAANCGTTITPLPNQNSQNASYNFTVPGVYTITLTTTNSCGSPSTSQTVTVRKPPTVTLSNIADFCQSVSLTPVANVISCTNGTPTFLWGFPGGTPSSATSVLPPSVTYATAGNHTITLAVTNECGTTTATSNTFGVLSAPTIQNATVTVCSGVTFSVTPSNSTAGNVIPAGTTYSWLTPIVTGGMTGGAAGTNLTSISGTLNNPTSNVQTATYTVSPKLGNCNGASFTVIVTVNPAAQVNQPVDVSVCNGVTTSAINFTTTNPTGTTFSWTNSTPLIGLAASGNGNVPAFMAVNTTNAPIIATITVTPSFSGGSAVCSGVSKTFTITVNPSGQVNQPTSLIKCNGDAVTLAFLTSNTGGTTIYNWTNDTTSIGLVGTGTGNISFTATNSTSSPLVATIIVIPTYNNGSSNCIGSSKTFTITINPEAQVNQPNSISVCNGNTIPTTTFSTLNTSGTTTYTWTNSNTAIGLPASGTGNIPSFAATNIGNSVLTATIIVTPSYLVGATSCTGSTKQFTITVSPNANLILPSNKVVCNGSSLPNITFTSTNTGGTASYSWTNDTPSIGLASSGTGNIPVFTAVNTGLFPITATLLVTPSFTNGSLVCTGTSQTFTITVNPSAQINSVNNIEVCNGNSIPSIVFSTNNSGGITTYSWTNSNTNIGLAATGNGNIPTFTANNPGSTPIIATITIIPVYTNAGVNCSGTNQTFTIKVNPSPAGAISGTVTVCLNATAPLITFTGSTGNPPYIFTYTINNGANQTISTTSGNSISINAPTNVLGIFNYNLVNVQDSNAISCLNTISQSATVNVTAAPSINVPPTPTQSICVGGIIQNSLTVTYSNGTGTPTYQWYSNTNSSTTGGSAVGTNSPNYAPPVFNTAGSFYYYVIISFSGNGCGSVTSAVAEIVVVNDPIVTAQPMATQTLCQNEAPTNLTVTISGGIGTISYQWFSTSTSTNSGGTAVGTNSFSFTPPTNSVGTFYYYCLITQSGVACSVNSNSATVIINTSPTIVNHPISSTVCQSGTPATLSFTYSNGVGTPTYQWYSNSSNSNTGGTSIPNEINPTFIPPSTTTGIFYYYCVITFPNLIGSCSSVPTNVAIATINAQSTIDIQPLTTQSICVGGIIQNSLTVTYSNGTGTSTYQWYSNTNSSTTGGSAVGTNSPNYTPPVFNTAGSFYYYVIISFSGNGCGSVTSAVAEIVVVSDPVLSTQPLATQTQCQNTTAAMLTILVSGGIGTLSYQWYSNSLNSNSDGTIIVNETNTTFTPPTSTIGTLYYYCVVTQTGLGCGVTSSASIVVVVAAPIITTQPLSVTVCEGAILSPLTVAYTNGTGTASYQWYNNNGSISGAINDTYIPSNTVTNTYYCIVTFSTVGCASITSNSAAVTINPLPIIDVQPLSNQSLCVGATIPTPLTITYTGGTGTASYQWYSNGTSTTTGGTLITGATSSSYTPSVFTTVGIYYYYIIVTLSGSGCGNVTSAFAQVDVVDDPTITTQPLVTQTVCQNSTATGLSLVVNGGVGNSYSYQWFVSPNNNTTNGTLIVGETNSTFVPPSTSAGTLFYYCLVTQSAGNGCEVTSTSASVTVNLSPAFVIQPISSTVCVGQIATTLSFTIINEAGTANYQWYSNSTDSNVGGTLLSGVTNATYIPPSTVAGTLFYYCVVTFPSITGGCSVITTDTATVIINPNPVIASQSTTICSGASFTIAPTTTGGNIVPIGTTYTWTNPSISPVGAVTGASSQGTPQNDISQSLINTTTSPAPVTYTVTPTSGVCVGNNFTITVTVNPAINPNIVVTNSTCFGINNASISTSITGGIPFASGAPYIVSWTGPNGFSSSASTISNLLPGVYNVTIDDAGGCPFSNAYTITEPSDIVITVDNENDITCFESANGSVNLSIAGGTGNYFYTWTINGNSYATTEDISSLSPGIYIVSVTDVNNCGPKTATFTIIQPPILAVNLVSQTNVFCNGAATGVIVINVVGGTPNPTTLNYTFGWIGPNGFTSSSQNLDTLSAGTYNLTVTDNQGCVKNLSVNITQSTPILVSYTTTPITCYGANNASLSASISGGNAPYQFQWNNLSTTLTQTNLSAGTYTVTVTDNLGCIKVQSIIIPEAPVFMVNPLVTNISCYGANNGSINLNLTGGIAPVALSWSDGSTSGLIRNNLGPGTYTATISDGTPCYIIRTFTIVEPQQLMLSVNITNPLNCTDANSGAINLLVSGGTPPFNYSWSNGATTEDLTNVVAGNYLVTVTDANGCNVSQQYALIRPTPILIAVSTQTDFNCASHDVTQNFVAQATGGVPPFQYLWSGGNVSGTNNEIMNSDTDGTVILTVTDNIGCTASYTVLVDNPEIGFSAFDTASFGYTTYGIYSIGDPITFQSTITGDYVSVSWDFGDGTFSTEVNPVHTYAIPKDYVVTQTVTYPFGCVYVQTITLLIEKGYVLVVPTAFTPNNDTLNDTYRPVTKALKNVKLDIYDTWGSLIYSEIGDVLVGWDSKINGFNAENGNYYSKVSAETFYGTIVNENQTFVLIK